MGGPKVHHHFCQEKNKLLTQQYSTESCPWSAGGRHLWAIQHFAV